MYRCASWSTRLAVALLLIFVGGSNRLFGAEPPAVSKPALGSAATPEAAFEVLRHTFVKHDFSRFWDVTPGFQREQFELQVEPLFGLLYKKIQQAKDTKDPERSEQFKAINNILGNRSLPETLKLPRAQQWAILLKMRYTEDHALGKTHEGIYIIVRADTRIVDREVEGTQVRLIVENQWKYRRKRSEIRLTREGATWRYTGFSRNTVGKAALGAEGLTVSKAKKKELLEAVHKMIVAPDGKKGASSVDVALIRQIGPAAVPVALAALNDPKTKPEQKNHAAAVLRALGEEARDAVPGLVAMLASKEHNMVRGAASILVRLGRPAAQAMPTLVKMISKDTFRAGVALAILSELHMQPERAVPLLLKAVKRDPPTRYQALFALSKYGRKARPALDAVVKLLDHKDPLVQALAVEVLGEIGEPALPWLPRIRTMVKKQTDDQVMGRMYRALQKMERIAAQRKAPGRKPTAPNPNTQKPTKTQKAAEAPKTRSHAEQP